MQVDKLTYWNNPEKYDVWQMLALKEDNALALAEGETTIEIRAHNTEYRGNVLICAQRTPKGIDSQPSEIVAVAELYDVKRVRQLTQNEWKQTRIPVKKRRELKGGKAYIFRNVRKVVEMPVRVKRGWRKMYFTKDCLTFYPQVIKISKKDRQLLNGTI